jgi:hypothetical protein
MNPRIKSALDNIEQHETKAQAFMRKLADSKGLVIPLALTGGAVALGMAVPSISESIGSFAELLKSSASGVGVLKDSHPKIFYGIVSGLIAGGAIIAGIGYLESRDEKKVGQTALDPDTALRFQQAWEEIVQTNDAIVGKVARQQAWAHNSLVSNPDTNRIFRKNGIDPANRAALIDLQKAYIHGIKNAFVTARKDGRHAEISANTFDQYTNKNIMIGMVSYYQEIGQAMPGTSKSNQAYETVVNGINAIREIVAHQGKDVALIARGRSQATRDSTISR